MVISNYIRFLALLFMLTASFRAEVVFGHTMPADCSQKNNGAQLRADLEAAYSKLVDQHMLVSDGSGNDVTNIVSKYITSGTSFDNAENLLKCAGFSVSPRPGMTPLRAGIYGVEAVIPRFSSGLLSKSDVYVYLEPRVPGDFSVIKSVEATILNSSL